MSGQHDDVWCLHWGTSGLRDDELLLDAVVGLLCFLVALYTNPGGGGLLSSGSERGPPERGQRGREGVLVHEQRTHLSRRGLLFSSSPPFLRRKFSRASARQ